MSEVVCCEDCENFQGYGSRNSGHTCLIGVISCPCPSDYCSYAVKKEEPKTPEGLIKKIEDRIHHYSSEARSSMDHASDCINEAKNNGLLEAIKIIRDYYGVVEETKDEKKDPTVKYIYSETTNSEYDLSSNDPCVHCSNNPKNGGNGICFCTIKSTTSY